MKEPIQIGKNLTSSYKIPHTRTCTPRWLPGLWLLATCWSTGSPPRWWPSPPASAWSPPCSTISCLSSPTWSFPGQCFISQTCLIICKWYFIYCSSVLIPSLGEMMISKPNRLLTPGRAGPRPRTRSWRWWRGSWWPWASWWPAPAPSTARPGPRLPSTTSPSPPSLCSPRVKYFSSVWNIFHLLKLFSHNSHFVCLAFLGTMVSGIWLSYLVLMLALMLPGLHRLVQSPTLLLVLILFYVKLCVFQPRIAGWVLRLPGDLRRGDGQGEEERIDSQ